MTGRRTMTDFAHQMRWLADAAYPEAEKVRVVLDNLNTHRPASLYEAFEPKEARRVIQRLEFHYTPKHGSWQWLSAAPNGKWKAAALRPSSDALAGVIPLTRKRRRSGWCWTTCRIDPPPCTRPCSSQSRGRRVIQRLPEFHYTPKHGSWLNPASSTGQAMAETGVQRLQQCGPIGALTTAELKMKRPSNGKSQPWRPSGIRLRQPSTGDSPRPMPGTSSGVSIHRFHTDAVLAIPPHSWNTSLFTPLFIHILISGRVLSFAIIFWQTGLFI